jgi:SagB-type dehydrogenase family enzyme
MKNRTSSALVFSLADTSVAGFNFLQKSAFEGTGALLDVLNDNKEWTESDESGPDGARAFVELGAMVAADSAEDAAEREFEEKWAWGLPAALFHFSVQGNAYLSLEQGEAKQLANAERLGFPDLYKDNSGYQPAPALAKPAVQSDLIRLMARRRSDREPSGEPVPMQAVSDILFSGMGITGSVKNAVAALPLSMTPSGGGRNPYEAYLFARKVDGLAPGIYHYSAMDHTLGRLAAELPEKLGGLLGGQDWADEMSCIIVLAAFFERTMWKYDDPNAYRVVLIEAGHIGQNMLLAATDAGLSACPTAALSHEPLFELLELPSRITCAPVYAIAVGAPKRPSEHRD